MKVNCLGIGAEVFDMKGNLIGTIGMHDFDGYIQIDELKNKVDELARKVGTGVYCLNTQKGYHFISFEIFGLKKDYEWKVQCRRLFPSDFFDDLCDEDWSRMKRRMAVCIEGDFEELECPQCGRIKPLISPVLRISPKGRQPEPEFLYASIFYNKDTKLSGGHFDVYRQSGILDLFKGRMNVFNWRKDLMPKNIQVEIVPTKVRVCKYPAELKES